MSGHDDCARHDPSLLCTAKAGSTTANLVVDVYDIAPDNTSHLVTRGATLTGTAGASTFDLLPNDWKFAAGHRVGVRVTNANHEWWLSVPSLASVRVTGGEVTLPFQSCGEQQHTPGGRTPFLDEYLGAKGVYRPDPGVIAASENPAFTMPDRAC